MLNSVRWARCSLCQSDIATKEQTNTYRRHMGSAWGWWIFYFCEQCHKGSILDQVIEKKKEKAQEFKTQLELKKRFLAGEISDSLLFTIFDKKTVGNPLGGKKEIADVLPLLIEKEKFIIAKRFGLFGAEQETLEEVAKQFGVTRERMRQIEMKAFRTLRSLIKGNQP